MSLEMSPGMFLLGGVVIVALGAVQTAWRYRQHRQSSGYTPGLRTVVSMVRPIMSVMPAGKIPFTKDWHFSVGPHWWARTKYESFRNAGQDVIAAISLDATPLVFNVADADLAAEVLANRARFTKPIELYGVLELYGRNVVTTEGEDWRIHRKITGPSFSESSNRLVCEETVSVMEGLFEIWKGKDTIDCDDFSGISMQLALMVICGAGFGMRVGWTDTSAPPGHKLSFKMAIETVSKDLLFKFAVPGFAMGMTERTKKIQLAFEELQIYVREMIADRSSSYRDYSDLFSNLLAANENDSEGLKLTDGELTGNIFIFLIAGHETTAHTLAFTIGLLALYPEVQEKLLQHVMENVADPSGAPIYSEIPELKYATAVFHETLRLYPSVSVIPKQSVEDTTVRTVNSKGEPVIVPIPKGAFVNVITPALHYNPRYWPEPDEFKPERFLGDWPRNAFVSFSAGARSCIGRRCVWGKPGGQWLITLRPLLRFAEVEGTVVLSMLVRNYRIEVKHDPKFAGETFAQRKARVLGCSNFLTITPDCIPVTFIRRQ